MQGCRLQLVFHFRSSLPEVFYKQDVLRNFTKFTGKHLCQSNFYSNACSSKSCRTCYIPIIINKRMWKTPTVLWLALNLLFNQFQANFFIVKIGSIIIQHNWTFTLGFIWNTSFEQYNTSFYGIIIRLYIFIKIFY